MSDIIQLNQELSLVITHDFDLASQELKGLVEQDKIREKLAFVIQHFLNNDFNKLLTIFYRIDLDEKKVSSILSLTPPDQIALSLADLVIERELKKVHTRLKYRDQS